MGAGEGRGERGTAGKYFGAGGKPKHRYVVGGSAYKIGDAASSALAG